MNQDTNYFSLYKNSISGAAVQYRKDHYHFSKHLHTSVELYLIKSGTCFMTIGDTTLECIPNDFVMIPPNVVHSFYLNDENECSFYHIHFFPEFLSHITLEEDSTVNLMLTILKAKGYKRCERTDFINYPSVYYKQGTYGDRTYQSLYTTTGFAYSSII